MLSFFTKKQPRKNEHQTDPHGQMPKNRLEIELSKDANKKAVKKAKAVNAHVKELFDENGFTVTIVLAASNPRKGRANG